MMETLTEPAIIQPSKYTYLEPIVFLRAEKLIQEQQFQLLINYTRQWPEEVTL